MKEEEEIKLLQKLVKQRRESLEIYRQQGRDDLAERAGLRRAGALCLRALVHHDLAGLRDGAHYRLGALVRASLDRVAAADHRAAAPVSAGGRVLIVVDAIRRHDRPGGRWFRLRRAR